MWLALLTSYPIFDFVDAMKRQALEKPWTEVTPLDRLWPLVTFMLFCSDERVAITTAPLLWQLQDRRVIGALDAFLNKEDDSFPNDIGVVAAVVRTALSPLTSVEVEWVRAALSERGPVPARFEGRTCTGLLALLTYNAKLDAAFALLTEHAIRLPKLAIHAASIRGNDAMSRELLRRLWSNVRAFTLDWAIDACRLAVSFGDSRAAAALPALAKAEERENRRIDRM